MVENAKGNTNTRQEGSIDLDIHKIMGFGAFGAVYQPRIDKVRLGVRLLHFGRGRKRCHCMPKECLQKPMS